MSNYLRNRPFMVITYSKKPLASATTNVAGWAKDDEAAWDVNENMIISDRVSDRQLQYADVVIDLLNSQVIKNRIGDVKDNTIVDGYVERYMVDVKSAMRRWVAENSGNLEKIRQIAKDHNIELPKSETDTSEPAQ